MDYKNNGLSLVRLRFIAIIITVCGFLFSSATSRGNTWIWNGGAAPNLNWDNPANWFGAGIPNNGDSVIFQGAAGLNNTNNIANLTLGQIRFNTGGFTINGNSFTLTNSILCTNTSGVNMIQTAVITLATADVTVTVSNGVTLYVRTDLIGNVGVVKNGAGTLIYQSGENDYTGTTTVNMGTLDLDCGAFFKAFGGPLIIGDGVNIATVHDLDDEEIPSVPVTINSNATLDLSSTDDQVGTSLTLNGSGSVINANPLTLAANATVTANPGFFSNTSINGILNVGSGTCTFNVINSGFLIGSLLIPASVVGVANINVTGIGFTTLSASNSFTGQLNVLGGTLTISSPFALGSTSAGTTVSNTATLWISGVSVTNEPLTIASTGNGIENGSGANVWKGPITLAAPTTFSIDGTSLDLQSAIGGSGGFTKIGAGTLRLSAGSNTNSYTGNTTVSSGVLELNGFNVIRFGTLTIGDGVGGANADIVRYVAPGAIFGGPGGNTVVINNTGLLDLNGFSDDVGPIYMDGGTVNTEGGLLTLFPPLATFQTTDATNGNSTVNGNLNLLSAFNSIIVSNLLIINAVISGGAGNTLAKSGPGNLFVTGPNTYSGLTLVQQGLFYAQNNLALGSTVSGTIVSNNASLVLDGGVGITNESLTLNGPGLNGIGGYGSLDVETGVNSWTGPITNNVYSTLDSWSPGSALHINGPITGAGSLELFAYGPGGGTIFYEGSAANTYGGAGGLTTVDPGCTLMMNKSASDGAVLGNLDDEGTVRYASSDQIVDGADVFVDAAAVFDFAAFADGFNTLRGAGSVTFGSGGFLEIGVNNGTSEFDGVMSGTGFPGGFTVAKLGTGTFTLTGTNTYLNETEVYGGTVVVNGSQLQSPVIVNAGTTLSGSGIVGSITAAGTIAPGNGGPGVLTCSNLTFTATGTNVVQLTGPAPGTGYDQINPLILIGANTLANATLQVIPNFTSPVSIGQQFTIVSNATPNPFTGTFNGLPEGALIATGGYTFRISYVGGTGNDAVLTLLGVPGNTVTVTAANKGWYDSTGLHTPSNKNYFAGLQAGSTNQYRNFFVFTIPISSAPIVHAELFVDNYFDTDTNGQETYLLRKVTTPISTLDAGGSGLVGIYTGLGTGAVYSVRSIATNEASQKSIIPLNVQFMNDAMAASGGQLAMGGTLVPVNPTNFQDQYFFGGSVGAVDDVQLRLTYGTNIVINATNRGWYDSAGAHTGGNLNYLVGDDGSTIRRNYFEFNLPAVSGQLVDAQLLLNAYTISSTNPAETYQLYDVTTPIPSLTNSQTSATSIYNDLGSGSVYGGRDVYTSESGQIATMPLNGNFLSAVQANGSGPFALGGAMTTLAPFPAVQYMFAFSGNAPSDVQLWLGFYVSPISHPTFVGNTPTYLGNGQFQITLSGASNSTNEIQGSFDFQRWDYITDVKLSGTTGTFSYTNNTVMPYRFFRAEPLQ